MQQPAKQLTSSIRR